MSVALVLMNVNKFAVTLMAATSACVIQAMRCQEMDTVVMVHICLYNHALFSLTVATYIIINNINSIMITQTSFFHFSRL